MSFGKISVSDSDRVERQITSDRPTEFYPHGYDIEREVEPDETATVAFEANITGLFEIEGSAKGDSHSHTDENGHSRGATGTLIVKLR